MIHLVSYPDALLTLGQRSDGRYSLLDITITGGDSVTREGIHVGSSLADVLRAYGGSIDNANRTGSGIRHEVELQWLRALRHRGQRTRLRWDVLCDSAWFALPPVPRTIHATV